MKRILLLLLVLINLKSYSQNLQLQANLSYGTTALANIGGYVDSLGNEYALVGTLLGLDIVDVTIPANPIIKFTITGPTSEWREVKTYRKYAYVTTEDGASGLTIIDLSHLPDTIYTKQYLGDGAIINQLNTIHALHCDTAKGFLYLYGSNIGSGNSLFINLSDPWNPVYAGSYTFPSGGAAAYVHDGYVLNDTMYESHIYSGFFAVVDVRDKMNPVLLATQTTPTNFVHNTWLSDDHKTLFTTDENSGSFLAAYDISDLANIKELSRFQTAPGSGAIVHNTHILNDYAVTSWYKEGVVIVDEARPRNPIEVAHYDTYPSGSGNGFNGCWGVYPFLPSGTIVASDIDNGLFVFTPTYIRGCYLEGTVSDSVSLSLLNGAQIEILSTSIIKTSDLAGEYRTGTAVAGSYTIRVSKPGYITKTISNVQLTNGVLTSLNILLTPLETFAFSGTVTDSINGQFIANANVVLEGNGLFYATTANGNGLFSFPAVVPGTYTMSAGIWGYHTACTSINLSPGNSLSAILSRGYYDDFTFDFGWTVNGSSLNAWERADPIGTYDNSSNEINPENDVTSDCGTFCFVTDNGTGPFNTHDVDNGNTILNSPIFDASIYIDPSINYYRRFIDVLGFGQPNDTMRISLSNGITSVIVETINPIDGQIGDWVAFSYPIASLITPTANMQLSIEIADYNPGNIVEGAFDQFEITGQLINKINQISEKSSSLNAYPNPFSNEVIINYKLDSYNTSSVISVKDILGKTIFTEKLRQLSGQLKMGKNLSPGIYLIVLENGQSTTFKKIIKE